MEQELPKQIQDQLDQAAAIERKMFGQPEAPVADEKTPEVAPAPVQEPVVEQPVEEAPQSPVIQPTKADENWEQKFHVLRGKYDAEVPRLNAQVRELSAQISDLLTRKQVEEAPKEITPKLITEADEEAFGKDLIDAVRRAAREESAKLAKQVDKQVDERVKPMQDRLVQNETQRFWSAVDTAVPDFNEVNQDPRWFQYLDTRIPGTRTTYRTAAQVAVEGQDAEALIEMVSNWKQSIAPPPAVPQSPAAPSKAQAELQRQVAPTSRKTQSAPSASNTQRYTAKDFQYWNDPRRAYDTESSEVTRMQAELDVAHAEGRITW